MLPRIKWAGCFSFKGTTDFLFPSQRLEWDFTEDLRAVREPLDYLGVFLVLVGGDV